jgi:FlaA1/EpsC-like NDP-sugar epimerase
LIKKILYKMTLWSRIKKQVFMILVDSVTIVLILLSSFSLRLDYLYFPNEDMVWAIFGAPIVAIPIFYSFRLYLSIVRYIGFKDLWEVVQAASLYSVVWGLGLYTLSVNLQGDLVMGIPRSVILINWMLSIIAIGGLRLVARWVFNSKTKKINVIIYGAGVAGRQLAIVLNQSDKYKAISFIDDSITNHKQSINGIKVLSPKYLGKIIVQQNISEVLIAIPSLSRIRRREIIDFLEPYSILVRSLPSVDEIVEGRLKIEDLKKIDIHDLLGRDQVKANNNLLKLKITDKVVLVTGAGGSIGSELCRQILSLKPKKLILFEVSEHALYQIEQELVSIEVPNVEIEGVLGSVRNYLKLESIYKEHGVQTIYHAAAYKHVPIVELNQSEGILNNSIGTWMAAEAAITAKVETFVLISTDKAVRPTNIMGASKRVAELVLQALEKRKHKTCFTMVRFGNVLDSSGSVIPLFRRQIEKGGPVTVTDKNIVRYFMTIREAVELVIQAGAMGKGGEVFVLDMGEPVLINELAIKIINLSGLQVRNENNPDGDIEISYIGLRPGEKLFEELLIGENVTKTENSLIYRAEEIMIDWDSLNPVLKELEDASNKNQDNKIKEILMQLVPEFVSKPLI